MSVPAQPAQAAHNGTAAPVAIDNFTRMEPLAGRLCSCSPNGRNLVVCIDGTANQIERKNTNVVQLCRRLVKDHDSQLAFYTSGIGTYATPSWKSWSYYKQVVGHKIDLAIAWRFERILLGAYLWLSENYKQGDRIFLFGFSRGAYQVRALSAMIDAVGLVHKGNHNQIPFAYQLYAGTKSGDRSQKEDFKATCSWKDVCVHFVGAWDTVSSIGIVRHKNLPGTADGMNHVCYFRHALALHERRVKFLPEYVCGALGKEPIPAYESNAPHTKEVWFAGSHSDVGGRCGKNQALDRFGPSLRWMLIEATQLGLKVEKVLDMWKDPDVSESLAGFWKLLEYLPFRRLSYSHTEPEKTTLWPHLARRRVPQIGQLIHESAFEALRQHDKLGWRTVISVLPVERDPYSTCRRIFVATDSQELPPLTYEDFAALSSLMRTEYGSQLLHYIPAELDFADSEAFALRLLTSLSVRFIYGRFMHEDHWTASIVEAARIVIAVLDALEQRVPPSKLRPIAQALVTHDKALADELMVKLSNPELRAPLRGHASSVLSVAFLSNETIVSASEDSTLRIWNIETGTTTIDPMEGHLARSVAVHESRIALCSFNGTFGVWNDSGETVLGPIAAPNDDGLHFISFSREGRRIATGGNDNRVRLWDANTGVMLCDMAGHTAAVTCVAFSKNGRQLLSGSRNGEILGWDVEIGECMRRFVGHTDYITAVCFGPYADRIFSSSYDTTIRLWDARTERLIVEPLRMEDKVLSMALSPDGHRLVAGSKSGRIVMWDAETGAMIPTPFEGHGGSVLGLAFSPYGDTIAAAVGTTIALWDATDRWKQYQ